MLRHKDHIEIKMSRSLRRLREIREQGSILMLNDILEQVRRHIAAADADAQGNYLAVFRGSHVASRLIHQMGRVEGDMQPDTLHRLISSPAWVPGSSLLPTDPKLMTGLHQGLLDGAFAPCPEPTPEISDDSVGRESAAPPAFREPDTPCHAPAASSGFSYDPYLPAPGNGFYLPSAAPPAADASQEILPEPQAPALAAFSKNFAPSARPAQDQKPDSTPNLSFLVFDPCSSHLCLSEPESLAAPGRRILTAPACSGKSKAPLCQYEPCVFPGPDN